MCVDRYRLLGEDSTASAWNILHRKYIRGRWHDDSGTSKELRSAGTQSKPVDLPGTDGESGLEGNNIPLLACRIYHLTLVIAVLRTKRGHVCRVVASRQTNVLGGFNTFGHHQAAEGCPW